MVALNNAEPENVFLPIVVIELGITTEASLGQLENTPVRRAVMELGMLTLIIPDEAKAYSPIEETELGIITVSKLVQFLKAPLDIKRTLFPIFRVRKLLQPPNADPLLLGYVISTQLSALKLTVVKSVQFVKACCPILVTELGMVKDDKCVQPLKA